MGDLHERIEKMRRLISLREQLSSVAEGEPAGLAAVKAEGRRIVMEREARIAEPVEEVSPIGDIPEPEPPKARRRRRGRRGGRKRPQPGREARPPAPAGTSGAANAAQRSLDGSDDLPPYKLRLPDGSVRMVSSDDHDVGPNARR